VSVATLPSRAAALDQVGSLNLPTKRDEAWRYAPHKALANLTFGPASMPSEVPDDVDAQIPELDGPRLVLVNGVIDAERSDLSSVPAGVSFVSLTDVPDANVALLDQSHDSADDAFSIINRAYGVGGALIQVDGQPSIDGQPAVLHIVDVVVPGAEQNASTSRVVIDVAAGGSITVVETLIGSGPRRRLRPGGLSRTPHRRRRSR